jgi:hypothetical protein
MCEHWARIRLFGTICLDVTPQEKSLSACAGSTNSPHAVNVEGVEMPTFRKDTLFRYRQRDFFSWSELWLVLTIAKDGV